MNASRVGADASPALTMALPAQHNGVSLYPQTQQHHHLHHAHQYHHHHRRRRLFGCGDENGNHGGYGSGGSNDRSPTYVDNTTLLVDELEALRNDNFQLRLRVYNAEQRVDELIAADQDRRTWCCRRCGGRPRAASLSADSDAGASETGSSVDNDGDGAAAAASENAAAMASMAKSAVRTISDLMTVNQRLIALLNAVLSAKPVSKSDEDDRRWQTLRNQIKQYCNVGNLALQGEKTKPQYDEEDDEYDDDDDDDDEDGDDDTDSDDERTEPIIVAEHEETAPTTHEPVADPATAITSIAATTSTTTIALTATTANSTTTVAELAGITITATPDNLTTTTTTANENGSADDELARLRARCQQLELSIQQLVNTELWARNRQIGKLEQQRCVAQQQQQRQQHRNDAAATTVTPPDALQLKSQPAATSTPLQTTPKGILVQRPRKLTSSYTNSGARTTAPTMKSPPPVLPDYSEVNFFFSCDEEDDQLDLESDANEGLSSPSSSVSNGSRAESDDDGDDREKPVRLQPADINGDDCKSAGDANNNDRPPRRQCWRSHRHHYLDAVAKASCAATTSSSTESAEVAVSNGGVAGVTAATSPTSQHVTAARRLINQAGGSSYRRQRSRPAPPPTAGHVETARDSIPAPTPAPVPVAVADAQVQCDHVQNADEQAQVRQLRRELDARRRENSRLYEMLLKLQRKESSVGVKGPPSAADPKVPAQADPKAPAQADPKAPAQADPKAPAQADPKAPAQADSKTAPSQRDTRSSSPAGPKAPPPRDAKSLSPAPESLDSDPSGSPEPYRRAARAVRGRIADLLPPLLMRTAAVGSPPRDGSAPLRLHLHHDDGRPEREQQQQQVNVLNRLRDRIVEYERQVLLGEEDASAAVAPGTAVDSDAENAEVRRMDRAALVNVALPRVVDRFRRVLQVQQQQQQQQLQQQQQQQQPQQRRSASEELDYATAASERRALADGGGDDRECNLRRRRQHNRTIER